MNESAKALGMDTLQELEENARRSTTRLNTASGRNAIWDKALKALKPALTDLDQIRKEAEAAAAQAREFLEHLEESYDGDASDSVREVWAAVDQELETLKSNMNTAVRDLDTATISVVKAKHNLDLSKVDLDKKQKALQDFPKEIQDGQKLILKLQGEAKDADAKQLLIETVVKLEDLKKEIGSLKNSLKPEYEAEKWKAFNDALTDLIQKTDALVAAQDDVLQKETTSKEAKIKYEEALKNRLDVIKKRVADEEKSSKTTAYSTASAR